MWKAHLLCILLQILWMGSTARTLKFNNNWAAKYNSLIRYFSYHYLTEKDENYSFSPAFSASANACFPCYSPWKFCKVTLKAQKSTSVLQHLCYRRRRNSQQLNFSFAKWIAGKIILCFTWEPFLFTTASQNPSLMLEMLCVLTGDSRSCVQW